MVAYELFEKGDILRIIKPISHNGKTLEPTVCVVIKHYPSGKIELLGDDTTSIALVETVLLKEDMENIKKEGNVVEAFKELADKAIPLCFMYLLTDPDRGDLPLDFSFYSCYSHLSCVSPTNLMERLHAGNLCDDIFRDAIDKDGIPRDVNLDDMRDRFNMIKEALL